MVGHELRTGGAVQTNRKQIAVCDRSIERIRGLAREHGADRLNRSGNDDGNVASRFAHQPLHAEHRGFDVASVEARLDQHEIDTAIEQRACLIVEVRLELGKGNPAGDADRFCGRPDRARHEARAPGPRISISSRARQFRRAPVQRVCFRLDVVFSQDYRRAAESVRLDDVGAGFEISSMHGVDDLRTGLDQILVASLKRRAAEVFRSQILLLQHGAHGSIEHNNTRRKCVMERLDTLFRS